MEQGRHASALMMRGKGLAGKKGSKCQGIIATVLPDPSIDASDTKIFRTITRVLKITGAGFGRTRQPKIAPIVDFEPPLDSSKLHVHVRMVKSVLVLIMLHCKVPTSQAWYETM